MALEKVGGHNLATVAIEEGESSAECGSRNTPEDGLGDNAPPPRLSLVNSCQKRQLHRQYVQWARFLTLVEEVIEQQGFQLRVLLVSGSDVTKENAL